MARQWQQGEMNGLALIAGGFVLVSMSIGGYVLGMVIDRVAGTAPTGAIIGLIVGTLVGFWDLYRIASRLMRTQSVPTERQQQIAKENWEKTEDSQKEEGLRDENHE